MIINLNDKIAVHFKRLEDLANEAAEDEEQSYSSRAAAMSALTAVIKELTKSQAEVVNMENLLKIEQVTKEVVQEFLTPEQITVFLDRLEEMLG